jgi:protein gp37
VGANSKIEWCDHTFNPWIGCTRVSAACDHCYAEALAHRHGWAEWGNHPRRRTSAANWKLPLKWNREAGYAAESYHFGEQPPPRPRVFCASLADVFDNQIPDEWRTDLWRLINSTPNLDWLLLTKRPQNMAKMLPDNWMRCVPWPNVWLGTTCENQEEADRRIPHLLSVPAKVHFLSCEPLLGPIDLLRLPRVGQHHDWLTGEYADARTHKATARIDWVIAGGESGPHARPMHPDWARSLRDQCAAANVPYFFKQWGEWLPWSQFGDTEIDDDPEQTHFRTAEFERGAWCDVGYPMWCQITDGEVDDAQCAGRVGKPRAGRLLDGIEHNGFPGELNV